MKSNEMNERHVTVISERAFCKLDRATVCELLRKGFDQDGFFSLQVLPQRFTPLTPEGLGQLSSWYDKEGQEFFIATDVFHGVTTIFLRQELSRDFKREGNDFCEEKK